MLITERSESKQDVLQDSEIIYLKYTFLKAFYDTWLIICNQSNQFPRDVETSTQKNVFSFMIWLMFSLFLWSIQYLSHSAPLSPLTQQQVWNLSFSSLLVLVLYQR